MTVGCDQINELMIEIIEDRKQWREQLSSVENLDFYHTYDYHQLSKKNDERPVLIKYTAPGTCLLLPLLLRNIENSEYKDAISVYGYAGILTSQIDDGFNTRRFHSLLNAYFNENKIISVFSRLHPYLAHQEDLLKGLGSITTLGKVVYIDLKDTVENQRKMFNKRMKTYLNKSRKICTVIESKSDEAIKTFIRLYHENMKRVDADDSYFFDKCYFERLFSSTGFTTRLMLCINNNTNTVIAGALFIEKGKIIQYHLSGLDYDYYDLNAVKLIIDEMRIKSTQQGFEYLNLGGGRGSREDSLFVFKHNFSKHYKEFKIWKYIVNQEVYESLTHAHLGNSYSNTCDSIQFFPAYRSNLKIHL